MLESSLLRKIFPETITNRYSGHPVAYYVFIVFTLMTIGRSLIHMFAPDGGAQSIASINLLIEGGETIVGLFAQWGLSQLLLGILFGLVIVRYRSLIPLMYVFIFSEYTGRLLLGLWKAIETSSLPPGAVANLVFPFIALLMLVLALREQ